MVPACTTCTCCFVNGEESPAYAWKEVMAMFSVCYGRVVSLWQDGCKPPAIAGLLAKLSTLMIK